MRSEVRKHLIQSFRQKFEQGYPQFSLLELANKSFSIWSWQVSPKLWCFVALDLFDNEDCFTVEIAWNESGSFPWTSFDNEMDFNAPSRRIRLGLVGTPPAKEPVWDLAPEVGVARAARWDALQAGSAVEYPPPPPVDVILDRVIPAVEDSLLKFQQYGLPVLNQVARFRGIQQLFAQSDSSEEGPN